VEKVCAGADGMLLTALASVWLDSYQDLPEMLPDEVVRPP
jgi:hypothetical protein